MKKKRFCVGQMRFKYFYPIEDIYKATFKNPISFRFALTHCFNIRVSFFF